MTIALVVGHHSSSPGADNPARGVTEWEFNTRLALDVWKRLRVIDQEPTIVFRRTYKTLVQDVNDIDPRFAVSMHANASFGHEASGTEVLYYHRSEMGRRLAEIFQAAFVEALGLRDRGAKGIDQEQRGGSFLAGVSAPAIICEPFFIDHDADLERAMEADLAGAYVEALKEAAKL